MHAYKLLSFMVRVGGMARFEVVMLLAHRVITTECIHSTRSATGLNRVCEQRRSRRKTVTTTTSRFLRGRRAGHSYRRNGLCIRRERFLTFNGLDREPEDGVNMDR